MITMVKYNQELEIKESIKITRVVYNKIRDILSLKIPLRLKTDFDATNSCFY